MKAAKTSWRTTVAGIGAFLIPLGAALSAQFDGDPATVAQWVPVGLGLLALFGFAAARDNGVSSESAGAK